jgi:thiol-disulfide isomerase/thioredoxin
MIRLLGLIAFLSVGYSIYEIVVSEREKESAFAVATGERGARSGNPGGAGAANEAAGGGGAKNTAKKAPVSSAKRPKVILFTGLQWCPPCQHLERYVINSSVWGALARDEVAFQKVNVPRDSNLLRKSDRELLTKYAVSSYPTMVVLDSDGRELGRRVGASSAPTEVANWVRSLSGNL